MAISMRITATLCFIIEEDNILLIYKKKGFGLANIMALEAA